MPPKPFAGSKLKIDRAISHIGDIERLLDSFGHTTNFVYTPISETEAHIRWDGSFSKQPSEYIPLIMGDSIHNLRSALDILICDIARIRNIYIDMTKLKFPFSLSESKFKSALKDSHVSELGDDVVDAIIRVRPYREGNGYLRALHQLDIIDKHQLILPTYFLIGMKIMFPEEVGNIVQEYLGFDNFQTNCGPHTIQLEKHIDPHSLIHIVPKRAVAMFPDGIPLENICIVQSLRIMTQIVKNICDDFSNRFNT